MLTFLKQSHAQIALGLVVCLSFVTLQADAHQLVPPVPKLQAPPSWPGDRADEHDVVVPVILTVAVDGSVADARVEASVSQALDAAALAAVRRWLFEPARRDGVAVSAVIRSVVRFAGRPPSAPTPTSAPEPSASVTARAPTPPAGENGDTTPRKVPDTVRVEGQRPPRSASEVVRGRDVLQAAPHRTASDLLTVVPGVFVTQHSGEGKAHQIFLRGFDAVHGQDIELSVGGVPVNDVSNVHGQGYADLHFVMPEVVKEVRALSGPYDPRQGDFAVAGSIAMRLGYQEPGATARVTQGSFGTRRVFLAYRPPKSTDETFAAFENYTTDGFGPNRAARRSSAVAQFAHDLGDGLSARFLATGSVSRFDSAGVVRLRDIEQGRIGRLGTYDPRQGGDSSRVQLLAELRRDEETDRWSIAPFVVLRSMRLRQNFTGYFADSLRGGQDTLESDNTQQLNEAVTMGMNASYRTRLRLLSTSDAFEAGVYARHDWVEQSQQRVSAVDDRPTEVLVDAKVRATNLAGYLDATLHPIRRVTVRAGLRADGLAYATRDARVRPDLVGAVQGRSSQGTHLGSKATLDVVAGPGLHLLASYGEGFRSPQARSLANGERTPFTEVTAYEVGARYGDGPRFESSLAVFRTLLSQDLVFDPATARNERVPATERIGASAELTARPSGWLVTSVSFTYTRASFRESDGRYVAGDLLPYVPQFVTRADISVRGHLASPFGRDLVGRAGMGLEGVVRRPLPYAEFGNDIFLVDVSAGLRWGPIEFGIDAYNVLDARWYDGQFVYPSNFDPQSTPQLVPARHVTVGPPLTALASLSLYLR